MPETDTADPPEPKKAPCCPACRNPIHEADGDGSGYCVRCELTVYDDDALWRDVEEI